MRSNQRAQPGTFKTLLSRYGYHVLFGISIASLLALVLWWGTFIRGANAKELGALYDNAMATARSYSLMLGHQKDIEPALGLLERDNRLEVVPCAKGEGPYSINLQPFWQDRCIRITKTYISGIEYRYSRRSMMVMGESGVLFLVILIALFMLYRMIALERRSTAELREFWSRITHEIKTPITGIKAFLQTVRDQQLSREDMLPLVDMALRQVERQEMLTENILIGQRISKQGFGVQPKPIALTGYIYDFLRAHRVLLTGRTVDVTMCPDSDDCAVMADPDALRVILENLLDNALKYGGSDPKITIATTREGSLVLLRFSDYGLGFDPARAEVLFDAYRRLTDELPDGQHGTGMGLYISRQLARRMGGDLVARGEGRGTGATFIISLPMVRTHE